MKGFGIALTMVGVLVAFVAVLLPTSVDSVVPDYSPGLGGALISHSTRVVNLDLLQRQTLTFAAGATFFLAGIGLLGAGSIIDELKAVRVWQEVRLDPTAPGAIDELNSEVEEEKSGEAIEPPLAQVGVGPETVEKDLFPLISMGIAAGLAIVALIVGFISLQH